MFSKRLPEDLRPNALARLRASLAAVPFDLTVSNPTACGIPYPEDLLSALAEPEGLVYRPDPRGLESARRALAEHYRQRGTEVNSEQLVLTASSSEAYGFLFKLLCDAGDAVLVPVPSYPLFEHLAALDSVRAVRYRLDPTDGWQPVVEEAGGPKALIVVHPNNPTGSCIDSRSAADLKEMCARQGMALIADEVFLDYPLSPSDALSSFAATREVPTFTLGGLSKSLGLPQLKLSWIVVSGPAAAAREALRNLEFIADNYLSVGTPVQLALVRLLERAAPVRAAILERCRANLSALRAAVSAVAEITLPPPRGGWSAVLRFPAVESEEALAIELLRRDGVAVHPGYFFEFPAEGYLVLSLLPPPGIFAAGVRALLERIRQRIA